MVLYEKPDDFGMEDTFASKWWGSSCEPIACCNVRQFKVAPVIDDSQFEMKDAGRGLQEIGPDVDIFTVEEFRNLFGEEPDEFDFLN